jgi:hypothetical protein
MGTPVGRIVSRGSRSSPVTPGHIKGVRKVGRLKGHDRERRQ